ncbi:cation:dicarboxylate symporter family transporter, partial [Klebsiella michiganensis]|uniref:cation:dicarboxylate symporter family transporter n=1 Tax=Klebsiella michiganensis TaxID=1134687 RepID=UPI0013D3F7A0
PEAGLLLIIGIDQFLDMGRSATNVLGNSVATVALAKWEGQLAAADQRLDRDTDPVPEPAE